MIEISRPASGGFKRIILLPFMALLLLGFPVFWGVYLAGSRQAVRELVHRLASDTAMNTTNRLTGFLERTREHSAINAAYLIHGDTDSGKPAPYEMIFLEQLRNYPELAIVAVGFSNGDYYEAQRLADGSLRTGRAGASTDGALQFYTAAPSGLPLLSESLPGYDPRQRPWYRNAMEAGGPVWSDIYRLYSGEDTAISSARPFRSAGETSGVVTTVVTLRSLSNFLSSTVDPSTGIVLVLDESGSPIASSRGFESIDEPDSLTAALAGSSDVQTGKSEYLTTTMSPGGPGFPDWKVVVALREGAFTGRLVSADRTTFALLFIMLALYFFVGLIVVNTVTGPIRELQQTVVNIDLTEQEVTGILTRLARKKNEIGNLAESFLKMHIKIGSDYESLRNSLSEKELLLKEVHHRVKNNLQIVSSMLSLQAGTVEDPAGRQMILQCQDRIQAMAFVHEDAYSSGRFTGILMKSYLSRICDSLQGGIDNTELEISVTPEELSLSLDNAIPCGLIVNELVTNALKHAFTKAKNGKISISLGTEGSQVRLSVRDNGSGMDPAVRSQGLGSDLLTALAIQLGGTVSREISGGVCVTVSFSAPELTYML